MRVTFRCSCGHTTCIVKNAEVEVPDWRQHNETRKMIRECITMGRHPEIEVLSLVEGESGQLRIESFM